MKCQMCSSIRKYPPPPPRRSVEILKGRGVSKSKAGISSGGHIEGFKQKIHCKVSRRVFAATTQSMCTERQLSHYSSSPRSIGNIFQIKVKISILLTGCHTFLLESGDTSTIRDPSLQFITFNFTTICLFIYLAGDSLRQEKRRKQNRIHRSTLLSTCLPCIIIIII